ncbi:3-demethylubiquinone-9 3-methyltransferase [Microbacterium sp. CH12i]|uniref:VOC family protein n=1 Tax=Microbacterium sp. CH12i TaxID=1479651 RepID=UPI000461A5D6|nr:VOC family protein [Microbacterium sp. CH12i]KDA04718.1 3-demethylubiquinone-9 3-methyltransferase [Microbacterium sp. CH12i]
MTQKIVPNLWFNHDADDAAAFYAEVFPGATATIGAKYPDDLDNWQAPFAGKTLTIDLVIEGYRLLLINAGDEFRPNSSISFMLNFDPLLFDGAENARARLDAAWDKLAEGGRVLMPLETYPFSPHYGWVEDRYGVSWQLLLTNPEGEPRPFLIPQLMFSGPVQNKAKEAAEFYSSLFPDAGVGFIAPYTEQTGPADTGSVMFGEFRLAGQWFAMMDSAVEQDFTFTPGVSLEVSCADQEEIDRYWEALSMVPEAEQCGWLADKYGVSWQIIPANMGELMARPDAFAHMSEMKKLVIADF